jgi:hypothetical protein
VWLGTLYKDDPERLGLAYSQGEALSFVNWLTDRTLVSLEITGENFEISMKIFYSDIVTKEEVTKRLNERSLDDL